MDSGEKSNVAQKKPSSLDGVARRVGGVLANLVPNSKPLYREREEGRAEPRLSIPQAGEDAAAEADVVLSLDAQRKKHGGRKTRDHDSRHEPLTDRQARSLDALRKKKRA